MDCLDNPDNPRNAKPVQIAHFLSFSSIALGILALAIPAGGAVLEMEPFDYPGSLGGGLNGLNGGTGWNVAWTDTDALPTLGPTNLSLEYPTGVPLTESGGRLELSVAASNNPAQRFLGTTMSLLNNQTFYSSSLFRRSALTGELTSVLFERSSDGVIRWFYGIDTNGFFSVAVDPSNGTQRSTSTFLAAVDTTYLVVSRIRTNTGTSGTDEVFLEVYEEGDVIAEPTLDADWDLRASGGSTVTLDRIRLAMSNTVGQTNAFDEFRVGNTFADVTGVPEPGSAALLALGAVTLINRRRARSRNTIA